MMSEKERDLSIVVGFYNFADVRALEDCLRDAGITIVSAGQDAQRVFDDAIGLGADAVLMNPMVTGYRREIVDDLMYHNGTDRAIPTVGWVDAQSDAGRAMVAAGAMGFATLPMDAAQGHKVVKLLRQAVEAAKREDRGDISVRPVAASAGRSFRQVAVVPWMSKGGGSTRTTVAVNLAVALSHVKLGNQPTALVDLDMTKGDCHTMLGYTANPDHARRYGFPLLEHGLVDLLVRIADRWKQDGARMITPRFLEFYTVRWQGDKSHLDLLPGIYNPAHADNPVFRNRRMIYEIGKRIIEVMRQNHTFVILDIGQDMTQPLHRAAIEAADEVVVTVPPEMPAVVDVSNALPALRHHFGDLGKFKLVITRYDPDFGMAEKDIIREVGLPKLATIPHDANVAAMSINSQTPFVLTDDGPLGSSVRGLASVYLPQLESLRGNGSKGLSQLVAGVKRAFVREA
jgi:Flp pilus assembly CpaE family ATPase